MLIHVDRRYLDDLWESIAPMLGRAVDTNHGEETIDQLRVRIAYGAAELVLWTSEEKILSVAVVEFKQYPNYRTAWVAYLSGATDEASLSQLKTWLADQGASHMECLCAPAQARLFGRYGMAETYRVLRAKL